LTVSTADKTALRKAALRKRDAIPAGLKSEKDKAIKERLLSLKEFGDARSVLFYASFRSEVETLCLIEEALKMGKSVSLPVVDAKAGRLRIGKVKGIEELSPGYMGIPEPHGGRAAKIHEADLIIVPGAAFDRQGGRLGYGKGYYDKLLRGLPTGQAGSRPPFAGARRPLTLALAYDEQVVEGIPVESHDITMDVIITDKEVIWTRQKSKRA